MIRPGSDKNDAGTYRQLISLSNTFHKSTFAAPQNILLVWERKWTNLNFSGSLVFSILGCMVGSHLEPAGRAKWGWGVCRRRGLCLFVCYIASSPFLAIFALLLYAFSFEILFCIFIGFSFCKMFDSLLMPFLHLFCFSPWKEEEGGLILKMWQNPYFFPKNLKWCLPLKIGYEISAQIVLLLYFKDSCKWFVVNERVPYVHEAQLLKSENRCATW